MLIRLAVYAWLMHLWYFDLSYFILSCGHLLGVEKTHTYAYYKFTLTIMGFMVVLLKMHG